MNTPPPPGRKAIASVAAAALTITLTGALSPVALAAAQVNRLAGSDRIDTSLKIWDSQTSWGDTVILARADAYPDALGAAPLAKLLKAPVVLTQPASLPASVKAKLTAKRIKKVVILGGTGAVSQAVETEITGLGISVERIAGTDRYQTSVKITQQTTALSGGKALPLLVATGKNFPDALTAGAAAAHSGAGFLLADTPLPTETLSLIQAAPSVTAIGGPAVQSMVREGIKYTAVYGKNRYDTAAQIATKFFQSTKNAYVATGANFPDALAASAAAALVDAPILLTAPHELSTTTKTWLSAHKGLSKATIIGGTGAVSTNTENQIKTTLTGSTGSDAGGAGGATAPGGFSGGSSGGSSSGGNSGGTGGSGSSSEPTSQPIYVEIPTEVNIVRTETQVSAAIVKKPEKVVDNEDFMKVRNTMVVNPANMPKKAVTEGGIISVLPTKEYPDGLLQKVLEVKDNPDGTKTLTTRQATLPEAVGPTNGPVVLPVYDPEKEDMSKVDLTPIPLEKYMKDNNIPAPGTTVTTDRASGITKTEVRTGLLPASCKDLREPLGKGAKGNSIAPQLYNNVLAGFEFNKAISVKGEASAEKKIGDTELSFSGEGKATMTADGHLGVVGGACIDIKWDIPVEGKSLATLKEFEFGFGPSFKAELSAEITAKFKGEAKKPLYDPPSKLIMVWAVPVTLDFTINGLAGFEIDAKYTQNAKYRYTHVFGITYTEGKSPKILDYKFSEFVNPKWKKIPVFSGNIHTGLQFDFAAKILGYAGPGGVIDVGATFGFKDMPSELQSCSLSFDATAGINGKLGLNLAKLTGFKNLPNWEKTIKLAEIPWNIYTSPNLCPAPTPSPAGTEDETKKKPEAESTPTPSPAGTENANPKPIPESSGLRKCSFSKHPGFYGEFNFDEIKNDYDSIITINCHKRHIDNIDGISNFQNLQALYLGFNQLTRLPREIGQLQNLQTLYLQKNQLTRLPKEIGQLQNLQTLNLEENQLSSLPGEIGQLQKLQHLNLEGNPGFDENAESELWNLPKGCYVSGAINCNAEGAQCKSRRPSN